jgi:hypothetical protein
VEPDIACHCRYCEPIPGQDSAFDDGDRKLMTDVADHGWHVVMIAEGARSLGWTFSVGMWHTLRSPELVMAGLPPDHQHQLINEIGERVRRGQRLGSGDRLEGLLTSGLDLAVREVDVSWYGPMFGYAIWFARRPPLPFLQIVWPDAAGRFAWEESFDPQYRSSQPQLWIPTAEQPTGGWSGLLAPDPWPFDEPEDSRALATKRVTDEGAAILYVTHDDDGTWHFVDDGPTELEDSAVVHLVHIVGGDPSIATLAELPRGWRAERTADGQPWVRHRLRRD